MSIRMRSGIVYTTHICDTSESFLTIARLAQSVERKALNLVVVGSSPTVGALQVFILP